jgi:hypothetical protein
LTYRNSRDVANDHVKEHDEEEAERGTFASGSLSVHFGEWERSAAVDDSVKVGDAVQDCNGIAESCDQTQRYLGENGLGEIDFGVGELWYRSAYNTRCRISGLKALTFGHVGDCVGCA